MKKLRKFGSRRESGAYNTLEWKAIGEITQLRHASSAAVIYMFTGPAPAPIIYYLQWAIKR